MTKKYNLITFDKHKHARGEFEKFVNVMPHDKANLSTLNIYVDNRVYMFRVVTDIDSAYAVGSGFFFDSIHFNGLIDADARDFLMTRMIGEN